MWPYRGDTAGGDAIRQPYCDHTGRTTDAHEPLTQHRFATPRLRGEPTDSSAVAVQASHETK